MFYLNFSYIIKEDKKTNLEGKIMKTVVIALSGGVDSAVAAYLLKEQGYKVIGLFMRNWDASLNNDILGNPNLTSKICTEEMDYNDALKVGELLNIQVYRVEFIKEYWDYVFSYFLKELKKGRTPNPDIVCNKYIKFDLFIKEAKKLGADYIATGHYARIKDGKLLRAVDLFKDQTYFLSQLTNKQLENVIFPIGDLTKKEVRAIMSKINLKIAYKKGSTGICFIGERNFRAFLSNYFPKQPGKIIDIEKNKVLGTHDGLMYYTIGQRKGLKIGGSKDKLYVVGKDITKNILYVAYGKDNEYLNSDEAIIENVNWLIKNYPLKCQAKFRYRQADVAIKITVLNDNKIKVNYNQQRAITPGQACVFYLNDQCLGGGTIMEVRKNNQKLWYL